MRITDVRIHKIAIADPPLRSSYGLHQPYALRTILELRSEDGIGGLAALEALKPRLIGANALKVTGALMDLVGGSGSGDARSQTMLVPGENPHDANPRTYAAIETACLDLIGKSLGVPLCDLLGTRVRDSVPFSAYPFYKHAGGGGENDDARADEYGEALSPEHLVEQVRKMIAQYGFKDIKFKAGVLPPETEMETVRQLHREFRLPVRMDPNSAWTVETSVHVGRTLREELGNATGGYLEDPTAGIDGMAAVRRTLLDEGINVPLASNVAVTCFADLPEAFSKNAVQIVLCDHHYWGGMRLVQQLAKICHTWGVGLSMHSNSHLGISMMAMAHVAAATPHLTYACDTHYPWSQSKDEVVAGGRVPIVDGVVRIPERGGLGVELDHDQVARGRERYAKCPYRKRDDEAEMRKHVDSNWRRVLPRW